MKRTFIFTIILLLVSGFTVKAQFDKGKMFIAGSNRLDLTIGGEKQKTNNGAVDGSEISHFDFEFHDKIGWIPVDNLVTGLFLTVDLYSDKRKDDTYTAKGATFIIGPFARFYFLDLDKLKPYAEAQVGFGIDNYKEKYAADGDWSKYNESVFTWGLGGGATYFFTDNVGADLYLGYLYESYKHKGTEGDASRSDHYEKYIYNQFIMRLGVVIVFDR